MTIDQALPRDIPAMIGLLDLLFTIEQDFSPDHAKQRRGLELLMQNTQAAVVLVARNGTGVVVGMVTAQLVVSTAEGANSAWIEDMVIAAEHRRRGVGRRLLQAVLEWARANGATRAQLLCDVNNVPASVFYDHQGWSSTRLAARRYLLSECLERADDLQVRGRAH